MMARFSARQFIFVALLLSLFAAGCNPARPTDAASISPAGPITLVVGQTAEISYQGPAGTGLELESVRSSDGAVAAIVGISANPSLDGRSTVFVTCVKPGTSTIAFPGATVLGYLGTVFQVSEVLRLSVTCVAAGAAAVNLIQVGPATLNFEHIVGVTGCPQPIGTILVTNVAGTSVDVTVTVTNSALTASVATFSLAAGATREVTVSFNCATQSSFIGQITIAGRSGDTIDAETVTVNGNVHP